MELNLTNILILVGALVLAVADLYILFKRLWFCYRERWQTKSGIQCSFLLADQYAAGRRGPYTIVVGKRFSEEAWGRLEFEIYYQIKGKEFEITEVPRLRTFGRRVRRITVVDKQQ